MSLPRPQASLMATPQEAGGPRLGSRGGGGEELVDELAAAPGLVDGDAAGGGGLAHGLEGRVGLEVDAGVLADGVAEGNAGLGGREIDDGVGPGGLGRAEDLA